ncbi:CBS-domain-containing protein [Tricholoma matsutake]|nr:CBS-domain-containing protein [Tricholoma matsutake 945]
MAKDWNVRKRVGAHSPKFRRKPSTRRRAGSHLPPYPSQESHDAALHAVRSFLKCHTTYEAFPVSFRLIVLDTKLNVKKALQCLLLNGVVSAPLWNSEKSKFAGMLTVLDIIHLIQYYYHTASFDSAATDVETFRLESLRDIEKELGVAQPPLLREHPSSTLYDAAKLLIQTHARRLPLLDNDTETGHEIIVSVLTQYRLLKFISINCHKEIQQLHLSLRKLKIGTYVSSSSLSDPYHPIATASLNTPVFDVVHMFSERSISAVPIIDEDGIVVNMYETVDVITLVRLGAYQSLGLTIYEALKQRSPDFPGVVICTASDSLGTLLQLIKKRRVHRLVVVEGEEEEKRGGKKGRLLGIITLSDVLRYTIGEPGIGEGIEKDEELPALESAGS